MALDQEDLIAAIEAVKYWEPGFQAFWIRFDDNELIGGIQDAEVAARCLQENPGLLSSGCPEVAIANRRNDITEKGLVMALKDLQRLFKRHNKCYLSMLDKEPDQVASILKQALKSIEEIR